MAPSLLRRACVASLLLVKSPPSFGSNSRNNKNFFARPRRQPAYAATADRTEFCSFSSHQAAAAFVIPPLHPVGCGHPPHASRAGGAMASTCGSDAGASAILFRRSAPAIRVRRSRRGKSVAIYGAVLTGRHTAATANLAASSDSFVRAPDERPLSGFFGRDRELVIGTEARAGMEDRIGMGLTTALAPTVVGTGAGNTLTLSSAPHHVARTDRRHRRRAGATVLPVAAVSSGEGGGAAAPAVPGDLSAAPVEVIDSINTYFRVLEENPDNIVVIKVYAGFCRACKAFDRKYRTLALEYEEAQANVRFCEMDWMQTRDLCKSLQVRKLPHIELYAGQRGRLQSFVCGPSKAGLLKEKLDALMKDPLDPSLETAPPPEILPEPPNESVSM